MKTKDLVIGALLPKAAIGESEFISELDSIGECYYNYLWQGFKLLEGVFLANGNDGAIESLKKEVSVIQSYIEGKDSKDKLIIQSMGDSHPKYGKRRLPEIESDAQIHHIYKHIIAKSEVEIWKHNDFDLLLEIAIAKCRALVKYESFINDQIRILRNKNDEDQMVSSFHWISDEAKLIKLYRLLNENEIIACKEDEFKAAFSGIADKQARVKWLLTSKNGQNSKGSIFHFIRTLISKEYISKINERILNKVIGSVFVDHKGKPLANLRQSSDAAIKKPDADLITKLINELRYK